MLTADARQFCFALLAGAGINHARITKLEDERLLFMLRVICEIRIEAQSVNDLAMELLLQKESREDH